MKASVKRAIEEARVLSEVHPTIKYTVMDKKGKRAVVTGSALVYKERILEGYTVVAKFFGGEEVGGMTLGKAAAGVVRTGGGTYNIGFNSGDETQFSAYDLHDLLECWIDFCADNGFLTNSVDYVERV